MQRLPAGSARLYGRPHIADLQTVMEAIGGQLSGIAMGLPRQQRRLVSNALLNLGVEHILAAEGPEATAAILQRLADLIRSG